ncbi:N-acylneuraminate-9-phosphate synthase [Erythrobacter sp. NAP1]|uniref:N-acetylneuraminate synthase family protein n=1 Tax=Erythrobacter sp. NAP1 TaxID=237727 RepID=UPI0000687754|nr:N-acetylneuraminate synthase family protein [Erythrobacter sp. NAP1]EAQ28458.1 N-acylneuraminate-9-phosphate synthase [Erythrobacter sp. NAP1]
MIIDTNLRPYVVFAEEDLLVALRKISDNRRGSVLCISQSGRLEGVLTDGDVRRWLVEADRFDFDVTALSVANTRFTAARDGMDDGAIEAMFSDRVSFVPVLDAQDRVVAVAWEDARRISIGARSIGEDEPCYIIAEIGNNHNGSLDLAKDLIELAAEAGADCAKFQMRDMASLYRGGGDAGDQSADLGAQYTLDLLARMQLTNEEMLEAFDHCKSVGIQPLCTPWDEASLSILEDYGLPAYKLASADLTNHELLGALARTGKVLICSTGMSSQAEIEDAANLLRRHGSPFVLLHCNSTYPAPFKDINLSFMERLGKLSNGLVGYSGHERGYHVPVAAVARGAKVVEKHFTLDRGMEGNDHRVSLLPAEFKAMVEQVREVEAAMGSSGPRVVTQGEMMNREVLGKSLVAARPIMRGAMLCDEDFAVRSPGQGLEPYRRKDLLGCAAKHDMKAGDFFFPSDLDEERTKARNYTFKRPFGVPVRYHDLTHMVDASKLDLVEFHFSFKDLEVDIKEALGTRQIDIDLVVHAPELFAGDHVLDLCSVDADHRARSIAELQRVIDVTRTLSERFNTDGEIPIIVNAGGFTADRPMPDADRPGCYARIADAIANLDTDGVEIIPQTMPPFPWHFGGQRFHNLFLHAHEIAKYCEDYDARICLDISHSALAATHLKTSFETFLKRVAPYTRHLHIVDAAGVDGEGLQIGDGTIDFRMVANVLDQCAPQASFIPEIWQGHKDSGAGFWTALDRLEAWF